VENDIINQVFWDLDELEIEYNLTGSRAASPTRFHVPQTEARVGDAQCLKIIVERGLYISHLRKRVELLSVSC
jgi:hypothetical protein